MTPTYLQFMMQPYKWRCSIKYLQLPAFLAIRTNERNTKVSATVNFDVLAVDIIKLEGALLSHIEFRGNLFNVWNLLFASFKLIIFFTGQHEWDVAVEKIYWTSAIQVVVPCTLNSAIMSVLRHRSEQRALHQI